jgi:hypothetical protein
MDMSISVNVIQNTDADGYLLTAEGMQDVQEKSSSGKSSIFAGGFGSGMDVIAQKKKEAQQKAWNVMQKAWDADRKIDQTIDDRRTHYEETAALKKEASDEIVSYREQESALMEEYGVSEDSDEQKDLELLKREQDISAGVTSDDLTKEERERLAQIHADGLTEYQERALELNGYAGVRKLKIADYDTQMRNDTSTIESIQLERLKSHPIADAREEADGILEAASKEMIGMGLQQMKDTVDEKAEEAAEKAKEVSEEKEEKEERLEEIKEERAIKEAMIEGTREAAEEARSKQSADDIEPLDYNEMLSYGQMNGMASGELQQTLDEIKSTMKVLEADLKGIKVDSEV